MLATSHMCPHCQTAGAAFEIVMVSPAPKLLPPDRSVVAHMVCGLCGMPASALFISKLGRPASTFSQMNGDPQLQEWTLQIFWPEVPKSKVPDHVPAAVGEVLFEAERAEAAGFLHVTAMAYGKSLDLAIKQISPGLSGTLHSRIQQLKASGQLLPKLADQAVALKGIRNDAMHEDETYTPAQLKLLGDATRMIMTYLFTIEGQLAELEAAAKS